MDTGRVETLLNQGWSLVGLLHQWLSSWAQVHHDSEELVDLISSLQTFWASADDLELKYLSRQALILEEFFERICAKRLDMTSEHLRDLRAGITNFEDVLLRYEATGEEPRDVNLELLQRLEQHTRQKSTPVRQVRTIEVRANREEETPVPPLAGLIPVAAHPVSETALAVSERPEPTVTVEVISLQEKPSPKRLEQKNSPRFDQLEWSPNIRLDSDESSESYDEQITDVDEELTDAPSESILILEESLFYRHLLQMALRSSGYETESIEPLVGESFSATRELLVPCRVILVTSTASSAMAVPIQEFRHSMEVKVIGLKVSDQDEAFGVELDACVVKSLPQQLISVLDQLLNSDSDRPRKIA